MLGRYNRSEEEGRCVYIIIIIISMKKVSGFLTKGFHIQSEYLSRTTIDKALEAIETYSYSKHRSAAKVNSKLTNGSDKRSSRFCSK